MSGAPSYAAFMPYLCSRCHTRFDAEADAHEMACPSCHAEAGLEPVKTEVPMAMQLFGTVLALATFLAVLGSALALIS